MARMNWDRAAGRDRVARFGGDRVKPDTYGRNKPPNKRKKKSKPANQGTDREVCVGHDWTHWFGPQFGSSEKRMCSLCGKQQSRKKR